jgi:uncharacterized membrane protein YgdD (TMEM256/DUF423 family)
MLAAFQTGVQYQLVHALALLGLACLAGRSSGGWVQAAGFCFLAGIGLFSGSLYVMSVSSFRALGIVTPFGGLAFLGGWFCVGWAAYRGDFLPPV